MLELIQLIFSSLDIILGFLDLVSLIFDVISWVRGKPNRIYRREALNSGLPKPKRDKWNITFLVFTTITIVLTSILIYRYWIHHYSQLKSEHSTKRFS
jgi:hypothetical protein